MNKEVKTVLNRNDESACFLTRESDEYSLISEIFSDDFYVNKEDLMKWAKKSMMIKEGDYEFGVKNGIRMTGFKGVPTGCSGCICTMDLHSDDTMKDCYLVTANISYTNHQNSLDLPRHLDDFIKGLLKIAKTEEDSKEREMYMVTNGKTGLSLQSFEYTIPKISDLDLHYGKGFSKKHKDLIEFINNKESGLAMLYGDPGTGKTMYIKYLSSLCTNKVIFLPKFMVDNLTSPNFIKILSENRGCVLVLEEADDQLSNRKTGGWNPAIENILNLSSGILSDFFSVKIICTFNKKLEEIDPAIKRKGRLIVKHKFEKIDAKSANRISKNIGLNKKYDQETALAEIYNPSNNGYVEEEKTIGFKR